MKTIPIRQLLREPQKIKRWTRVGETVHVTDKGEPLWMIQAAGAEGAAVGQRPEVEDLLEDVLREPRGGVSTAQILEASRR